MNGPGNLSNTYAEYFLAIGLYYTGRRHLQVGIGGEMQLAREETIADTARVISRYVDAVMIRLLDHEMVEELAHKLPPAARAKVMGENVMKVYKCALPG